MGGFVVDLAIVKAKNEISIFAKRKQNTSLFYEEENIKIKKYQKVLLDKDPYVYEDNQIIIVASGTISYHGLPTLLGFEKLKIDLLNDCNPEAIGHFSIIYFNKKRKELRVYFDEAGYGAPYAINNKFISSSFLACCEYAAELHLNHEAIFEEIYTGCYFNGKTSFNEIRKIVKEESWKTNGITVQFIPLKKAPIVTRLESRSQALNGQFEVLNSYFKNWISQINENNGDLGLSSGYDSRLMLGLLDSKVKNNYQVHSYWKKQKDFDNQIGDELATSVNKKLIRVPIADRNKISSEEFDDLLHRAMVYYDGLFPSNHGWTREYRTIDHRSKILGRNRFGLSGISGEQYRNEFHLFNKSYSINFIIKNLVLEAQNNETLSQSSFSSKGMKILEDSIRSGLDIAAKRIWLTREEIQRYYCEMWVAGGPGIRNQIENQISYFLSPFTDRHLQKNSYSAVGFLGIGGRFQADLIKLINPKLAAVVSDYGFSFDHIPLKHYIFAYASAFIGRKRKVKLKTMIRPKRNYLNNFGPHKKAIENKLEFLELFMFQFPIKSKFFEQDTIDRLIALSILLKHFESKIVK